MKCSSSHLLLPLCLADSSSPLSENLQNPHFILDFEPPNLATMPPTSKKSLARRPKLPICRPAAESSPSPSPPMRKQRATTTLEACARKLQREGLSPFAFKQTKVTGQSPSSSSSPEDPNASTTPLGSPKTSNSSSLINDASLYNKIDEMAQRRENNDDASPQGEPTNE